MPQNRPMTDLESLAKNLGHDLRNSLSAIKGAAWAARNSGEPHDTKTAWALEAIDAQVDEALALIDRLIEDLRSGA